MLSWHAPAPAGKGKAMTKTWERDVFSEKNVLIFSCFGDFFVEFFFSKGLGCGGLRKKTF